MFHRYILMGSQNWGPHPGRRDIFPVAAVFFTLPGAVAVFSPSKYSKNLSEYDFLSGSQSLASQPQREFSLSDKGRSLGAAKIRPQEKGTSEPEAAVPHPLFAVLQLLQRCHSPWTFAKIALTLQRLANPTHCLT